MTAHREVPLAIDTVRQLRSGNYQARYTGPDTVRHTSPVTGENLSPHTFYRHFERGCVAAGRPDLRAHDLRHTGAVLAAQTGATLADLMGRLGHSTPQAAMRYQHAAAERDRLIASRLSELASGGDRGTSSGLL